MRKHGGTARAEAEASHIEKEHQSARKSYCRELCIAESYYHYRIDKRSARGEQVLQGYRYRERKGSFIEAFRQKRQALISVYIFRHYIISVWVLWVCKEQIE